MFDDIFSAHLIFFYFFISLKSHKYEASVTKSSRYSNELNRSSILINLRSYIISVPSLLFYINENPASAKSLNNYPI